MENYRYSSDMHERFYKVRKALGLTQKEIGDAMGITPAYYSKLESIAKPIKKSIVITLCNTFDVRYDYLLYGREPMFNQDMRDKKKLIELFDKLEPSCQKFVLKFLEVWNDEGSKM